MSSYDGFGDSGDEFAGSRTSTYSPDIFYTAAGDIDHPKFIRNPWGGQTRVPTMTKLMVDKVTKEFSSFYGSTADFVRDASRHRAHYLLNNYHGSPELEQIVELNLVDSMIQQTIQQRAFIQSSYDSLRAGLRQADSPQERLTLQMHAQRMADTVNDPIWSDRFRELA